MQLLNQDFNHRIVDVIPYRLYISLELVLAYIHFLAYIYIYACFTRYGLVTFERTAVIYNIGVTTKFGTVNQLYDQLSSFSYSGGTEDGYVGIDAIIDEFDFRESENIRKHIILFTDEV